MNPDEKTRKSASLTGGGGFRFEDLIGSWLTAAFLAGASPLGPRFGPVSKIQFQTGRHLDDVNVESEDGSKIWHASIKTFNMLTAGELNAEFVRDALRELDSSKEDPQQTFVGFACGPVADSYKKELGKLIATASNDSYSGLANRIDDGQAFNAVARSLWESAIPEATLDVVPKDVDVPLREVPALLFDSLIPLTFDFEDGNSRSLVKALEWCGNALDQGSSKAPEDLWNAICTEISQVRTTGGSLDWHSALLSFSAFSIRLRPNFRPDWQSLEDHTKTSLEGVKTDIGDGLELARDDAHRDLDDLDPEVPLGLLVGPSGCGKTALAADWADDPAFRGVWLSKSDLVDGVNSFSQRLRLKLELLDVLQSSERPVRMVVDGLDHSSPGEHFRSTSQLVRLAERLRGKLQVLVTAKQQAVDQVIQLLREHNLPSSIATVVVGDFSSEDMATVLEQNPDLRHLANQAELNTVLRRPKLLQVVLDSIAIGATPDLAEISDESDVASLWWDRLAVGASQQTARSRLLKGLSADQGDRLVDATSEDDLGTLAVHADAIDDLKQDGILESPLGRISFSHDLLGDWSRNALLKGASDPLDVAASKSLLPPWHHAIRLVALTKLNTDGVSAWIEDVEELGEKEGLLASDLYLDAPAFSTNAKQLLESAWPKLIENNGALLNRLLGRFCFTATRADPIADTIFPDAPEIATYWATTSRIPLYSLWPPMIETLANHKSDAVELAPVHVSKVIQHWLKYVDYGVPCLDECASLGLQMAESLTDGPLSDTYFEDDLEKELWTAVLMSGVHMPEAIGELCETILAGVPPADDDLDGFDDEMKYEYWRQARDLREAVLDGQALIPFMKEDPVQASRILSLAVAHARKPRHTWRLDIDETLGITNMSKWFVTVPERGPFLGLLFANPMATLDVIISLVEAATDRFELANSWRPDEDLEIEIERNGTWEKLSGGGAALQWHRDKGNTPKVLVSALMAIESFLYRRLDREEEVEPLVTRMIASKSAAIHGVLTSVACYRPELLRGALNPLITSAGILLSDKLFKAMQGVHTNYMPFLDSGFAKRAEDWDSMPHRTETLWQLVMIPLLNEGQFKDQIYASREHWSTDPEQRWRHLSAQMDPDHYDLATIDGAGQGWAYNLPTELAPEVEASEKDVYHSAFWISMPLRLRQWIDSNQEFSDEDLSKIWEEMTSQIETSEPDPSMPPGIRPREDLECAVAAFFVFKGEAWLNKNTDEFEWVKSVLVKPFIHVPPSHEFDSALELTSDSWDGFAADALPKLWANDRENADFRRAIAGLAAHRHHETVRRVFRAVAREESLASDLIELEAFSLLWARFLSWKRQKRHREQALEFGYDGDPELPELPDVEPNVRDCYEAFVEGQKVGAQRSIEDFIAESPEGLVSPFIGARDRLFTVVDFEYLIAARVHRLSTDQQTSPSQREMQLSVARDLARVLGNSLQPENGEGEVSGTPYNCEWDLLGLLGSLVVEVTPSDARALWEPIFEKGHAAGSWVNCMLNATWRAALQADPTPAGFTTVVLEMIDLAIQLESWESLRNWPREIERAVVGIESSASLLNERHRDLFLNLQPKWGAWIGERIVDPYFALRVVNFLKSPSSAYVFEFCLGELAKREREIQRTELRLDESLGELLNQIAATNPEKFRDQGSLGEDLRTLLGALTGRQRPIGFELTSRLG